MLAVATQNLQVHHDENLALSELTVDVPLGVTVAVVGANGSGKSTLLGTLAGLHKPTIGTATTIERPALVLQATEVDDSTPITVSDAVKLGRYPSLGLFRRFSDDDHRAVSSAVERMGLRPLLSRRMQDLSGGQRQRVLMAQGLVQQSKLLLLDEPMAGLDISARDLVLDLAAAEAAQQRTVLMATHSLTDARACDLVLLLATRPVAFGPPNEVLTEDNLAQTFGQTVVHLGDETMAMSTWKRRAEVPHEPTAPQVAFYQ